MVPLSMTLSDP